MDENMNTITLRCGFIRPGVSLIMYASSLNNPGILFLQFGISARERPSGKKRQVLYDIISDPRAGSAGHESDPPTSSRKLLAGDDDSTRE